MIKKEDKRKTRERLLTAACEIFARDGFNHARVADICKLANANVASVNYYFTNKASLYVESWEYAFEQFKEPAFLNSGDDPPEEMLRKYIHAIMEDFTTKGRLGYASRLYLMELVRPTGLIHDSWRELIQPRRQKIQSIIREIMGSNTDDEKVLFCELSIVNQCRTLLMVNQSDLEYLLDQTLNRELIKRFADHIADFSLAGIKAISRNRK